MLKISQIETSNHPVVLKLEGRVIGPWVEELGHVCETLLSDGCGLNLDMTDVLYLDGSGVSVWAGDNDQALQWNSAGNVYDCWF